MKIFVVKASRRSTIALSARILHPFSTRLMSFDDDSQRHRSLDNWLNLAYANWPFKAKLANWVNEHYGLFGFCIM